MLWMVMDGLAAARPAEGPQAKSKAAKVTAGYRSLPFGFIFPLPFLK
jgi:hypothetical protein